MSEQAALPRPMGGPTVDAEGKFAWSFRNNPRLRMRSPRGVL